LQQHEINDIMRMLSPNRRWSRWQEPRLT